MMKNYIFFIPFFLSFGFCVFGQTPNKQVGPMNNDEDNVMRQWPGGKHGFYKATNIGKAGGDISFQMARLVEYINYCKRFPANLLDAYTPINKPPERCLILKPKFDNMESPWIDPWGRPYQVLYNKEEMKIQMRSQGRQLENQSDDIVKETYLSISKEVYDLEISKCKKLKKDDKGCAFNRDWH